MPTTDHRSDHERGLYGKYLVQRITDPTGKHDHCRYFVLDPRHDPHALTALRAYADACRADFPALAVDLDGWAGVLHPFDFVTADPTTKGNNNE